MKIQGQWDIVELRELVAPGRGISYGIVQPGAPVHDGVPIVRVSDIRNGRVSTENPLRVSPSIESAYARTRLQGGELLLTLVGTVGEAAIAPESLAGWNTARAVAVIPVRDDVGAYWVKLALRSPMVEQLIQSRLNTTVQATLNLGDVARLPIVLPPLEERRAVARILGTLDDKIELNRRMNETLEAIARALFQSWFVDFDPVRAKAEGRPTGLAPEIDKFFPNSFDRQGLPSGWDSAPIESFCSLFTDGSHQSPKENGSGTHFIAAVKDLDDFGLRFDEMKRISSSDYESLVKAGCRPEPGDVLFSKDGTIGRTIYLASDSPTVVLSSIAILRPAPPSFGPYLWAFLRRPETVTAIREGYASGSALPRVVLRDLRKLPVLRPPTPLIEFFSRFVRPILERIDGSNRNSSAITILRDSLLPRLMSGQIRVPLR